MKMSVLTCTNNRPEALALCEFYVERQMSDVYEHVVVDGGGFWENMKKGLEIVDGDAVVIMEDDDWYPPDWVAWCEAALMKFELFGQRDIFNYHIPSGGYEHVVPKRGNAAMHATAFRASLIPEILAIPKDEGKPRLDVAIWQLPVLKTKTDELRVISMKGMPGTKGYSDAHERSHYRRFDRDGSVLKSKIGTDAELYAQWAWTDG